ncbi:tail protein [Xanthomonas phage FoX2]|uniref:Tail protein n=1 Tax=Xanthomonas phage FoX2 TaxID=2723898 RepID=A0A858NPL3_9CAUD|nr:tail protein [Xanthomonas phage FoX2]QJB21845.1 tail protein [Xanthomonas phage FoX2]
MSYRETINGIIQKAVNTFQGNDSGNAPVLLMLGGFKFSLNTAVFTEMHRSTSYKWPAQERLGQYDALQFTGPGEDRMRLPGIIYPGWRGGATQIGALRSLAFQGRPLKLIGSSGAIMGQWVIENVEEGQSFYLPDGTFRKQEFTVTIRKFGP